MTEPSFVFKIAGDYFDEKGRHVQERVIIAGTPPSHFPRFIGSAQIVIRTPRGEIPQVVHFELEGNSVEEALVGFDKCVEAAKEEAIKQLKEILQSQKLVIPAGPLPKLPPNAGPKIVK